MISKITFTNLIQAMEGVHDLEEVIEQTFGYIPGPYEDSILSRLYSVEEAVYDILGADDDDEQIREIAGSDMDLEKKVDRLMKLYPGKIGDE